jgi:DNA-binding NtrC family response regulator/Tfp pilus assembly protein PilF
VRPRLDHPKTEDATARPAAAQTSLLPDEREQVHTSKRTADSPGEPGVPGRLSDLETLADLYAQSDQYAPALETLEELLARPEASDLAPGPRLLLTVKQSALLRRQGRYPEAWETVRGAVEHDDPTLPAEARVAAAIEGVQVLCHLARYDEGLVTARHAVSVAEILGDRILVARAVGQVAFVQMRRGDMLAAREGYEEALTLFRRVGSETDVAWVRNNLGIIAKNLGEWDVARAHFGEAIAIHRRLGQFALLGLRLQNLGVLLVKSGAWERAHTVLDEARATLTQVGSGLGLVANHLAQGWLARLEGRHADAEEHLSTALRSSLADGLVREEALAREFLGDVAFDRGETARALESYRAALALGERIAPAGDVVSEVLRRIAEVEIARGRLDAAAEVIERATHVCALLDDRYETAVLQRVSGQLASARGDHAAAVRSFATAINLFGEMGERFERGKALVLLARATTEVAETRKALYRASACFAEIGAERELAAVERDLQRLAAQAQAPAQADPALAAALGVDPALPARRNEGRLIGRKLATPALVGRSRALGRVLDLVSRAAATDLSVIVVGETGTGKELIARAIHDQGGRADRPFLAVNCGALRAELAASQLFGHRRGAFTGAHADGVGFVEAAHTGTLFLDEIGELPADVQVMLLRFLESGEYTRLGETQVRRADVRIVGATHVELRRAVVEKKFRADLFYRLHELEILLPALRERPEDVLPLARHFLAAYGGPASLDLSEAAAALLVSYPWPGNVRELENCMKRALALATCRDGVLDVDGLEPLLVGSLSAGEPAGPQLRAQLADADRRELVAVLDEAQGNKSRAAKRLGISRKTLYARMRRSGLPVD